MTGEEPQDIRPYFRFGNCKYKNKCKTTRSATKDSNIFTDKLLLERFFCEFQHDKQKKFQEIVPEATDKILELED